MNAGEYAAGAYRCPDCNALLGFEATTSIVNATVVHQSGCPWLVRARGIAAAGPAVVVVHREFQDGIDPDPESQEET